ncbi:DUF1499 domain-containing protein [Ancylobacter sp. 6x-1]|uniref:DUF1499 domain-containing protein n=1 Tax=Ancylobacter crimeensis TaxID=2579147 RepID=A0ABT0DB18_9HYPH|nr:DUF1499 domain-containing protein [Ancylobacter crimeensis]MCK0197094.1 DUF1499 domain-containing protein [Ancylobacter crimeensis]
MIRRWLYIEERMSRLATWSLRVAVFALPVSALALGLFWAEVLDFNAALRTLIAGIALAGLALLLAIAAFVVIWNEGLRGLGRVVGAAFLASLLLLPGAAVLALGTLVPAIHDVTTDSEEPLLFETLGYARSRAANALDPPDAAVAQAQSTAWPDVKPLEFDASPDEIYNSLLALVARYRWRVIDATPPRGGLRDGRIEATTRSLPFGLRADIALRVRQTASGVRVDMRSVSREGERDYGMNANRITTLMADLSEARGRRAR